MVQIESKELLSREVLKVCVNDDMKSLSSSQKGEDEIIAVKKQITLH